MSQQQPQPTDDASVGFRQPALILDNDDGDGMEEPRVDFFENEGDTDDDAPPTAFSPVSFSQSNRRISDLYSSRNDHELETTRRSNEDMFGISQKHLG